MIPLVRISPDAAHVSRAIRREVGGLGTSIDKAKRRAVNRTASWFRTRAIRAIAADNNIPQKVLRGSKNPISGRVTRGRRGRILIHKASRDHDHASIWLGIRPIGAGYLGTPHQFKYGAKVRGRKFPTSFVATMPSGHVGIFHRKRSATHRKADNKWGTTALPIREQYVKLKHAPSAIAGVRRQIPVQLRKTLDHELDYELRINGRAR